MRCVNGRKFWSILFIVLATYYISLYVFVRNQNEIKKTKALRDKESGARYKIAYKDWVRQNPKFIRSTETTVDSQTQPKKTSITTMKTTTTTTTTLKIKDFKTEDETVANITKMMIMKDFKLEFIDDIDLHNVKKHDINELKVDYNSYNFEDERFGVTFGKNQKHTFHLGNYIPSSDSLNILLVTRGRSGSSFVGNMISRIPGAFYTYEPLAITDSFGTMKLNRSQQIELVKDVYNCRPYDEFISFMKKWQMATNRNFRFNRACEDILPNKTACIHPQVYRSSCSSFPIRLVKIIRLPFEDVETFFLDPEIGKNLKVIFLFRDPRARLQSLKSKVHWCNKNETINLCNPSNLCRDLERDLSEAISLKKNYPGKFCEEIILFILSDIFNNDVFYSL